jgi:hypothetical protein
MTGQQTTDDTNDGESYLERLNADTRSAADTVNLDVSATVGPDHLGQETVDVDGHPCDRPGVRSRIPDGPRVDPNDPRVQQMDTGRELPVLLSSNMRTGPVEGTQGSFTRIVEGECARCGYDRLRESVQTMAGERQRTCNACGAKQDSRADNDYRMPKLDSERADKMRDSGEKLGEAGSFDVYDMEPDTGLGPYLYLINGDSLTLMDKETPFELYWASLNDTDTFPLRGLADDLNDELPKRDRILLAHALIPEGVSFEVDEGDQADSTED